MLRRLDAHVSQICGKRANSVLTDTSKLTVAQLEICKVRELAHRQPGCGAHVEALKTQSAQARRQRQHGRAPRGLAVLAATNRQLHTAGQGSGAELERSDGSNTRCADPVEWQEGLPGAHAYAREGESILRI